MRRVIALELVGLKKLDCDLYNEDGEIIYRKGTEFTPETFMMLTHSKVFKRDEEQLVNDPAKVTTKQEYEEIQITDKYIITEPKRKVEESEIKSVFSNEKKAKLIKGIKEILKAAVNKEPINLQICKDATNVILDEVNDKFKTIDNLEQMRVQDLYTFSHGINVSILCAIVGMELGFNENKIKDLTFAAFLHDVGKMQVNNKILYKPGTLTPEEMKEIKNHAQYGNDFIIKHLNLPEPIAQAALSHHERWEGQGYPNGLVGNQIPEFAQIVAVADVYDALVSEKIYRGPVQSIEAMRVLLTEEAKSFNPKILNKFVYMAVIKTDSGASCLL